MTGARRRTYRRRARGLLALLAATLMLAGCGEGDPGALGPSGIDGLSAEGRRQEYTDGVGRALGQLGAATQGASFAKAVDGGNRRQLQTAALAWRQGGEQLQGLDPPKDAAQAHSKLVSAVEGLDAWNQRIVRAAPDKARTRKLARQAVRSPASQQFEEAVCELVDAGYEVVDPGACTPLADAEGPLG